MGDDGSLLTAAAEEGGQEALQTVMERAAQVMTGADPTALDWTPEFRDELKASGALGAARVESRRRR